MNKQMNGIDIISLWTIFLTFMNKQMNPIEIINLWAMILTLISVILLGILLKHKFGL